MHKFKRIVGLASLCVALSPLAQAAEHDDGTYVEGNAGFLYDSIDFFGYKASGIDATVFNINGGYLFNSYFATELGLTRYQGIGSDAGSVNGLDLGLKAIYPFSISDHDFTVFLKAGPTLFFDASHKEVRPFAAIGASYSLTSKTDLLVQAKDIPDAFMNLGVFTVGLAYHLD